MIYDSTLHGYPPQEWDGKKWVYVKQENEMNLPSFLQNYDKRDLAERARVGVSLLPPHISIRGNRFALIDASGERQEVQAVNLDVCIFDVSDVVCKMFYANDWEPGSDDPPTCWSSNGVGPSREALEPQADTCAQCPQNVRGSDTSKLSGKAIKACRDEKYLAVLVPSRPDMVFRLSLTPGSFKNWDKFRGRFVGQQWDFDVVLTRLAFESGKNGVLTFEPVSYVDEGTYNACRQAIAGKVTDLTCGRLDVPIGAFPAPAANPALASPGPGPGPATTNGGEQAPRRRRRTRAEIEADEAAKRAAAQPATTAPFNPDAGKIVPGATMAAVAPFRPAEAPAPFQPAAFGMAPGVEPNKELKNTLERLFPK